MTITTILPVSRVEYLDRVLDSLKKQTVQIEALIVVFDGRDEDYVYARNKVVTQFSNTLFIRSINNRPADDINQRRRNISNIHNQFREMVSGDWIFSVEDDGVLEPEALEDLIRIANTYPDVGFATGVELGRWGVPYVGAWRADDVFNTKRLESMGNKTRSEPELIEEIDAAGLFCSLIRADLYRSHTFGAANGLGPDVNLGLYIRQCGFNNYIDWGVHVTHLTFWHGLEIEIPATDQSKIATLNLIGNGIWSQTKTGQLPF